MICFQPAKKFQEKWGLVFLKPNNKELNLEPFKMVLIFLTLLKVKY